MCSHCLDAMQPARGQFCSICGERVLSTYAVAEDDGHRRCPVCRRIDRPYVRAVAYGTYDAELRDLIHLLKYNRVRPAARVLGRMLACTWLALEAEFSADRVLVIPVPLYKAKRRQREFNQAELIARAACQSSLQPTRYQLANRVLVRTRQTLSQIGLTAHQRRENLRGAFSVAGADQVTGREVLLVDDVYTTGTTAAECARVLSRAGAARVWVSTVARTMKLASKYGMNHEFEAGPIAEFEAESAFHPEPLETLRS